MVVGPDKLGVVQHVIAVDIGGTKLAAAIVDERGALVATARTPTPASDRRALDHALVDLIDRVRDEAAVEVVACGVGCGGPMSNAGGAVSPLNIPAWRDHPLAEVLSRHTGVPTWVDNDAKALVLAEGWIGASVGCRDHLAMVVSTGVGGGIVVDGRLLDGADGNAGHIGHLNVVPGGRRCACGALGCLEAEASGTAIAALTGAPAAEAPEEIRERTGELVGRAVGSVMALLDLRLTVVAGSVALGYGEVFFDAARRSLDEHTRIDFARGVEIRPAGLGADGPLVGAAAVAWRRLGHDLGVA